MDWQVVGLLIVAASLFLPYSAYRSNVRSDASWERMRRDLTPVWTPPRPAYQPPWNPAAYFVGSTCTTFGIIGTDSGHTHSIGYLVQ